MCLFFPSLLFVFFLGHNSFDWSIEHLHQSQWGVWRGLGGKEESGGQPMKTESRNLKFYIFQRPQRF